MEATTDTDKDATQEFEEHVIMNEILNAVEKAIADALAKQDERRAEELRQMEERIQKRLAERQTWWKKFIANVMRRLNGIIESELKEAE